MKVLNRGRREDQNCTRKCIMNIQKFATKLTVIILEKI